MVSSTRQAYLFEQRGIDESGYSESDLNEEEREKKKKERRGVFFGAHWSGIIEHEQQPTSWLLLTAMPCSIASRAVFT